MDLSVQTYHFTLSVCSFIFGLLICSTGGVYDQIVNYFGLNIHKFDLME